MKNKKLIIAIIIIISGAFFFGVEKSSAANYTLEIIQPQPSLTTANRYYKAYPGIEYEVPIGVFGGLYPFTYALTENSTCDDGNAFVIDADTGIVTWSDPAVEDDGCTIEVRVTDDESATDTVSWTVAVTTTGFVFVDSVGGTNSSYNGCVSSCGDGTIANPFLDLCDIYVGTGGAACNDYAAISDATYNDYFVYFRGGTYDPVGYFNNVDQQYQTEWRGSYKPIVWLEYPGEAVIIDHDRTASGAFFDITDTDNSDLFIHGIQFQDMLNHALRIPGGAQRTVLFENTFYNGGPGIDGDNSSFVMFSGSEAAAASYKLIKDNTFDTASGSWAHLKSYSTNKAVHDGNTYRNGMTEGLAVKGNDQYVSIRNNSFDGAFEAGSINGNWASCNNLDISFNNVLNAANDYDTSIYGALTINYNNDANGPVYIYRNTFEGTVTARFATSDDGPFHLYNNVIINENADKDVPDGSYITHYDVADPDVIILGTGLTANLVGSTSDGIIDASGNLTEAYSSYLGTHGYQIDDSQPDPTYQCNDGADNDSDGLTDYPNDSGCSSETDDDETNAVSDSTPPSRSAGAPSGELASGTASTTISLSTNENATCKYAASAGTAYTSMTNAFSGGGGTSHTATVSGLSNGSSYSYYARCTDASSNVNTDDYQITFSVGNTAVSSNNDSNNHDRSSKKKKTVKKRTISVSKKSLSRGQVLIERGKRFSKSSPVLLYFSKPGGGYYPPMRIMTNKAGKFALSYKIPANKSSGSYSWYAVDTKTGKKSKTVKFKVK